MRIRSAAVCSAMAAVSLSAAAPAASAVTSESATSVTTSETPAIATFEGRTINLAAGWGNAKACLIWQSHGIAECFATDAELATSEAQLRGQTSTAEVATPDVECSSSLDLYSGSSYTGLHLALWDEGYWQELSDYGFANATRSFIGGACGFHLANGDWGAGYWYPGNTGAWASTPDMGSWDDTVKSVYIE